MERKIKTLTIEQKVKLINSFEKSALSKTAFCKQEGILRGTLNGIIQNKDKLLSNVGGKFSRKRKREG